MKRTIAKRSAFCAVLAALAALALSAPAIAAEPEHGRLHGVLKAKSLADAAWR